MICGNLGPYLCARRSGSRRWCARRVWSITGKRAVGRICASRSVPTISRASDPLMVRNTSFVATTLMGFAMFAPPGPASAQPTGSAGGALCLSLLLTGAHELASHCGDSSDSSAEQRYRDVQSALRSFVIESYPRLKESAEPQTPFLQNEQAVRER